MQENRFFDTSVLVYAFDKSDQEKYRKSAKFITELLDKGEKGIVSSQVLAELYNALTENISKPLPKKEAASIVSDFASADEWIKIEYDLGTVKKAADTSSVVGVEIWDALIAETMMENSIATIITENEKDFRKIPGIKVVNPFK